MAYKTRKESNLLKILKILNLRGNLTGDEQKYYLNLEKGYQGEVLFDLLTEKLQSNCYVLNDLQLEVNNKSFQIDSTIICEKTISIFEVKNFEGEYCYDTDYFRTSSGIEVQNPLDQLKRCTNLFRQLLQKLGYNFIIEGYVIFINPQFTLYQAPPNLPFILPTQTNHFLKKLDSKPSRVMNYHKNLVDKLISLHQPISPYSKLPIYKY